jgi:hypothetical protein
MRCFICNTLLSQKEIVLDKQGKPEPCFICIAMSYDEGVLPMNPNFDEEVCECEED